MAPSHSGSNDFLMPDLGEGLEEAELLEWCVKIGDRVEENQTLAKMETAKALVEVPSPRAGVIASLHGKAGQAIKVGTPLVTYRSDAPDSRIAEPHAVTSGNGKSREETSDSGTVVGALPGEAEPDEAVRAAPAVRRLAREMGVELEHVSGTGIGGRITAADVKSAAVAPTGARPEAQVLSGPINARSTDPALGPASGNETERVPFRGVRRTIAEHLRYSVDRAIHFTVMDEADVSALDELRRRLVAASNEKITLLPFVAAAVCRVLYGRLGGQFRRLNSSVDDDRQEIVQHRAVHLGIATDTDAGLMVPVIRDAHQMGVLEISRQIAELAKAARDRSILPHRLNGSTFTISNFGAMGGRFGTPIINYPEAGILAVGRAHEGVVVRGGMIGVGKLLPLESLSRSPRHRRRNCLDGAGENH